MVWMTTAVEVGIRREAGLEGETTSGKTRGALGAPQEGGAARVPVESPTAASACSASAVLFESGPLKPLRGSVGSTQPSSTPPGEAR